MNERDSASTALDAGLTGPSRGLIFFCNALVPGAGLVLMRREWLGAALTVLFTTAVLVALWGWLLIPLEVPRWVTIGAAIAAAVTWLAAQALAWSRGRLVLGEEARARLRFLEQEAAEALERGELAEARELLLVALTLNDEYLPIRRQWAVLLTRTGRLPDARRAWKKLLKLDRAGTYREEARKALTNLAQA